MLNFFKERKFQNAMNRKNSNTLKRGIASIVYLNDSIHLIFEACKSCYNVQREMSYEEIKDYIGRRVSAGHDSILEHSNIILSIEGMSIEYKEELANLCTMSCNPTQYLKILTHDLEDGLMNVVIGGTVRSYKHFIQNFDYETDNVFYNHILSQLYLSTIKEYWLDTPMVDKTKFVYDLFAYNEQQFDEEDCDFTFPIDKEEGEKFSIINSDTVHSIRDDLKKLGFNKFEDVEELCTITICFENMSRTATHQLVRHRNGITQESQRYVDYSKAGFTVPKLDYLGDNTKFDIILAGQKLSITASELAGIMMSVYPQLKSQGMKKEDARAFLPSNVQCGKLYMTFTFSHLATFFALRCSPHAQTEIREYALGIMNKLKAYDEKREEFIKSLKDNINESNIDIETSEGIKYDYNVFTPSARMFYEFYNDALSSPDDDISKYHNLIS